MQFQHDPVFTSPVFAEPVVFHGQAIAMPLLPQAVMAFAVYPSQKNDGDSNGCAGDHVGYAVVRRYIPMGCDRLSKLQLPHCNRGRRFVFDDVTRAFSDNFELLSPAANTSPFTTASMALLLSKVRAVCGSTACTDLRGGAPSDRRPYRDH